MCYRFKEKFPETWVFWVHGSNAVRFKQGFEEIAHVVKIPGRQDPKANFLQMVYRWLRDTPGRWLMVLDNVDDHSTFFNVPLENSPPESDMSENDKRQKPLSSYIPKTHNGAVLITTRDRGVGFRFTGGDQDIIKIGPMEEEFALALVQKKLGDHLDQHQPSLKLVQELDCMPLAITQAAAYISWKTPAISMADYLKTFQRKDKSKTKLLAFDGMDIRRDEEASNSIITTWQISFEHIQEKRPTAAQLLSLMSFFDRQGIPKSMLSSPMLCVDEHGNEISYVNDDDECERVLVGTRTATTENKSDGSTSTDSKKKILSSFSDDIAILHGFSLISIDIGGDAFGMHGLVQLAIRTWLTNKAQSEIWKQEFIARMKKERIGHRSMSNYQTLLPHVNAMAAQRPKNKQFLKMWMAILLGISARSYLTLTEIMCRLGEHEKAERCLTNFLEAWETPPVNEEVALLIVESLADLFRKHGKEKHEQAESMRRQGEDGLEGVVRQASDKFQRAEVLYRRAIDDGVKMQGMRDVSKTWGNFTDLARAKLGEVFFLQQKFDEMEEVNRDMFQSLDSHRTIDTSTYKKIGDILFMQGKFDVVSKIYS
jgi:hypothetical protein